MQDEKVHACDFGSAKNVSEWAKIKFIKCCTNAKYLPSQKYGENDTEISQDGEQYNDGQKIQLGVVQLVEVGLVIAGCCVGISCKI